ncbi:MAG: hypothetical protein Aurels2KO_47690 [Aureliella sp.]
MPQRIPITGLSEIVLNVADLPSMKHFYSEVLGFPVHSEVCLETTEPDPSGEPTITFLTIAETDTPLCRGGHPQLLALIDYRRHIYSREKFRGHDVRQSTLNHFAFEIPPAAFDTHAERLTKLGLNPHLSEFPALNARAIFFSDPEGNTVELICHHAVGE